MMGKFPPSLTYPRLRPVETRHCLSPTLEMTSSLAMFFSRQYTALSRQFNSFSWVNKFHVLFWHQSNCFRSFRPGQGKGEFFPCQRLVITVFLVCYSGCLLRVKDFRPARVSLENSHIPSHEQRDYLAEFVSALNAVQKKGHWFKWQLIN